jgi:hypothetical protein
MTKLRSNVGTLKSAPEFVSVPVFPTPEMIEAGAAIGSQRQPESYVRRIWARMLAAAAPSPEPRAVEGKRFRKDASEHDFSIESIAMYGLPYAEPAPQPAPAPLTEDERGWLEYVGREDGPGVIRDAILRALAIADHHRDSVGRG